MFFFTRCATASLGDGMNALHLRKRKIRECLLARNDEERSLLGDCPGLLSVAVIKHQPKPSGMGKGFISVYNTQGTIMEGRSGQELGTEAENMERCLLACSATFHM